jgi:two-component system sensor histidine kinase YesM
MYRGKLVVPLSEEIAHTKAYLELQRIRHKGEIRTTWEIDDALLGIQVPKFILQPLVENAVEHGIVRGQPLSMRISIRRRGIALRITVEDDGRGIAPEVLSDLRDTLRRGEQSEHLGLVNVNERIHLHHGEPLALRLSSTPGHGCTVSVTVPAPEGADVPKAIEESAVAESRANI